MEQTHIFSLLYEQTKQLRTRTMKSILKLPLLNGSQNWFNPLQEPFILFGQLSQKYLFVVTVQNNSSTSEDSSNCIMSEKSRYFIILVSCCSKFNFCLVTYCLRKWFERNCRFLLILRKLILIDAWKCAHWNATSSIVK